VFGSVLWQACAVIGQPLITGFPTAFGFQRSNANWKMVYDKAIE